MAKYWVLILGALVLFGALGYAIFAPREEILPSSVSVETGGDKIAFREYVSGDLDFAISYPEGWTYSEESAGLSNDDYVAIVFNSQELANRAEGVLPNIAVNYYNNLDVLLSFEGIEPNGQSLESYLKTSQVIKAVTPITLAGLQAWKGIAPAPTEDAIIDTVFVEHAGHIYAIGVSNRTGFDPAVEDAMISSFRFTNDK